MYTFFIFFIFLFASLFFHFTPFSFSLCLCLSISISLSFAFLSLYVYIFTTPVHAQTYKHHVCVPLLLPAHSLLSQIRLNIYTNKRNWYTRFVSGKYILAAWISNIINVFLLSISRGVPSKSPTLTHSPTMYGDALNANLQVTINN